LELYQTHIMPDSFAHSTATALPYAYPLDDFYARSGLALPKIDRLSAEELPEPYRGLLAHQDDMTPTLEKFHAGRIHLEILNREQRGDYYFREVVLRLDDSEVAVEFGAIKISLLLFPAKARQLILDERVPLGRILDECGLEHTTKAKAFFSVATDDLIGKVLQLPPGTILYGRKATIVDAQQRPLAEIVEILPPINTAK
jgi:chorismate-pyruvate lyase